MKPGEETSLGVILDSFITTVVPVKGLGYIKIQNPYKPLDRQEEIRPLINGNAISLSPTDRFAFKANSNSELVILLVLYSPVGHIKGTSFTEVTDANWIYDFD